MTVLPTTSLSDLYSADETAWLEVTADAVATGQLDRLDRENLQEYLASMANRDWKELRGRLETGLDTGCRPGPRCRS